MAFPIPSITSYFSSSTALKIGGITGGLAIVFASIISSSEKSATIDLSKYASTLLGTGLAGLAYLVRKKFQEVHQKCAALEMTYSALSNAVRTQENTFRHALQTQENTFRIVNEVALAQQMQMNELFLQNQQEQQEQIENLNLLLATQAELLNEQSRQTNHLISSQSKQIEQTSHIVGSQSKHLERTNHLIDLQSKQLDLTTANITVLERHEALLEAVQAKQCAEMNSFYASLSQKEQIYFITYEKTLAAIHKACAVLCTGMITVETGSPIRTTAEIVKEFLPPGASNITGIVLAVSKLLEKQAMLARAGKFLNEVFGVHERVFPLFVAFAAKKAAETQSFSFFNYTKIIQEKAAKDVLKFVQSSEAVDTLMQEFNDYIMSPQNSLLSDAKHNNFSAYSETEYTSENSTSQSSQVVTIVSADYIREEEDDLQ